jgi:hypothetical protein
MIARAILPHGAAFVQTSALTWLQGSAEQSATKNFTRRRRTAYSSHVPDKEGNGFGSLNAKKRTDRAMRFFFVRMLSHALYERRWQGSLRACWFSFLRQSSNPVICRSPHLEVGRGSTANKEAHMPNIVPPNPSPISAELAHSIGGDCASEWLNRSPDVTIPPASVVVWRAQCYADAACEYQDRADLLPLLAAWEQGFDSTLSAATATSSAAHVRQLAFDIENSALEVQILLDTVGDKLDRLGTHSESTLSAVTAIHCFVNCAMRDLADILEKTKQVVGAANRMQDHSAVASNVAAHVGGAA